jgi:quercetin dioxygenase-like cupin family protein
MDHAGYVSGSMKEDADRLGRGGWIAGTFFSDDEGEHVRATDVLEVKYWSFSPGGEHSHETKTSDTLEWSAILEGKVRALLGDEEKVLSAGDYVLIHPGTPNNLVLEVLDDVIAVTVKAPSDPSAKKVVAA